MSYQQPASAPPLEYPYYGIGFVDAIKRALKKYAVFSGRASRGEYWWFFLFSVIVQTILYIPTMALGVATSTDNGRTPGPGGIVFGVLYLLVALALFLPTLGVAIRRLHDAGYSGWYYLLCLIPLVGGIILIVFLAKETSPQGDRYNPGATGGYGYGYAPQAGPTYGQPSGYPTSDNSGYGQTPGTGDYPASSGYGQTPGYPSAPSDQPDPYGSNPYGQQNPNPQNPSPQNPGPRYPDPQNPNYPQQ